MKKLALLVISTIFISCTSNSSNEDSNDVLLPTLTTKAVSTITQYTAWSGGDILNDFNYPSISRGLVWSTNPNPTISLSTKTSDQFDNSGPGSFTSVITGLVPNTTYYMRSYATNSSGTSYGNEVSFITASPSSTTVTDIDGNVYPTVTIGNQVWLKTNLRVRHYRNGDNVEHKYDINSWVLSNNVGASINYNNSGATSTFNGYLEENILYNYRAVSDPRNIAPQGWHVATRAEWNTLINYLGGSSVAGGKMKETGTVRWSNPNTGATNSSGFDSRPYGYLTNTNGYQFVAKNLWASYWYPD